MFRRLVCSHLHRNTYALLMCLMGCFIMYTQAASNADQCPLFSFRAPRFHSSDLEPNYRGVLEKRDCFWRYQWPMKGSLAPRLTLRGGGPRAKKEVDLPPLNM